MDLKEKVRILKSEILQKLSTQDLVGKVIFIEDPINFPTTLVIQDQDGTEIDVEDDMGEVKPIDLDDFGIDTLISLVE